MSNTAKQSRRVLIAGNWKMFKTRAESTQFLETLSPLLGGFSQSALPQMVIAPPFTALETVQSVIKKLQLPLQTASQTIESHADGAYTGEISARMLQELGVKIAIIGHSERRQYFNETDASVNAKIKTALEQDITPIVCVGELLNEREAGQTDSVIERQVTEGLAGIDSKQFETLVLAYEPVWAIGTGKTCDSKEAGRVCTLIRQLLAKLGSGQATRILYGGSVKPDNIAELLSQSDIDGALVGGASLDAASYAKLIEASLVKSAC